MTARTSLTFALLSCFFGTLQLFAQLRGTLPSREPCRGKAYSLSCRQSVITELIQYLAGLQDSRASGLVPTLEGTDATTTYVNAMAAIAFTVAGEDERARRMTSG